MASISRGKGGSKRVLFIGQDGGRRAVRLGDVSVKAAESFKLRVEALLGDLTLGRSHDAELCAWLRDLPDATYAKLASVGLVEPREQRTITTLGQLLERYFD